MHRRCWRRTLVFLAMSRLGLKLCVLSHNYSILRGAVRPRLLLNMGCLFRQIHRVISHTVVIFSLFLYFILFIHLDFWGGWVGVGGFFYIYFFKSTFNHLRSILITTGLGATKGDLNFTFHRRFATVSWGTNCRLMTNQLYSSFPSPRVKLVFCSTHT